jgi:hypothetical protein
VVSSLSFSQSRYPLQTVIDGDSVVILTKAQADTINAIFDNQKAKIAKFKQEIKIKDSIITLRDTLLIFYNSRYTEYKTIIETQIIREDKLDTIREWLADRAKEGAWIYYSYENNEIVAVNLSDYVVRKDDYTGDIMFFKRTEDCPDDDKQKEPPVGWHTDIVKPRRPKLNIFKL